MKNNKKIMSVVASAAIVSQLLPMGTVIANAQTNGTVNTQSTNQTKPFENDIEIFNMGGNKGLKIQFDNKSWKIHASLLNVDTNKDTTFSEKGDENYNKVCLSIIIYGKFNESEGKPGEVLTTLKYKGCDKISKAVNDLNVLKFEYGQGMRIVHRSEKESRVKVSGEIINSASYFTKGADRKIMDSIVFINRGFALEKQQDRYYWQKDYNSLYLK